MSDHSRIEEHFLPEDMRIELCMSLLEEHGVEKINLRREREEIIHCCPLPWHNETHPSASLNFTRLAFRCLGCNSKGGLYWLIATLRGTDSIQAREWLAGVSGLGGKEFDLASLLTFLDSVDAAMAERKQTKTSIPKYSEKVLTPWQHIYPGLTTGVPELGIPGRGIPEENLVEARVGWDLEKNRIVIPHFWKGDLVGWQSRRILDDGTPKYESTPDFPRDSTTYGLAEGKRIVVVESPMSRLRHMHHQPIVSTFGFVVTPIQIQLLKWVPEIIFWMDNDDAGWKSIQGYLDDNGQHHPGAAQILSAYSNVRVVESDWAGDPAEFDEESASDLIDQAVPLAIWSVPRALRCMACKEYHEGVCAA